MKHLSRRNFLRSCAGAAATAAMGQGSRPPNVLFILADDLGWGDLGCYGNPWIRTPALNKLASQGTLFSQYYSNNPVCSPSRTAWMTGQFPARFAIHGALASAEQNAARGMPNWLDPKVTTITRLMHQAGYATAHAGKFDGVFCPNETSTAGMLIALEDRQLAGKVKFVGFDAQPRLIAGLRDGKLQGLVLQDPFKMGYVGVRTMLGHLDGRKVEPEIDTGAAVVTPENMNTPQMQRLLYPVPKAATQVRALHNNSRPEGAPDRSQG